MIFRSPFPEIVVPAVPLAEFVLSHAAERANKPALVDAETGRTLHYGQLAELVVRLAGGLRRLGLRTGDVLATLLPNVPEFPVVFLAVAHAGGTCSTMCPLYTPAKIATQLRDSGARYLLTVPALLNTARAATAGLDVRLIVVGAAEHSISFEELTAGGNKLVQPVIDPARDIVALPYSSGTIGLPKGVKGNATFYSATTTAYPLPHPGVGPGPIPVTLPAGQLGAALGICDVSYQPGNHALAIRDFKLSDRKPA